MSNRVCSVFVKLTVPSILVFTVGASACGSGGSSKCINVSPDAGPNACSFTLPLPCTPRSVHKVIADVMRPRGGSS